MQVSTGLQRGLQALVREDATLRRGLQHHRLDRRDACNKYGRFHWFRHDTWSYTQGVDALVLGSSSTLQTLVLLAQRCMLLLTPTHLGKERQAGRGDRQQTSGQGLHLGSDRVLATDVGSEPAPTMMPRAPSNLPAS